MTESRASSWLEAKYRPPRIALDPALEWVIARSFGPVPAVASSEPIDGLAALAFARQLNLSARIASRCPLHLLDAEIGPSAAVEMTVDFYSVARRTRALAGVCKRIHIIADEMGIPVVFLKGMAGYLSGMTLAGRRPIADVDVVAPTSHARELHKRLITVGFIQVGRDHPMHHLGQLADRNGLQIEIHEHLEVPVKADRTAVTVEMLVREGLTEIARGEGWPALVPIPAYHVAYAFHHALVQDREKADFPVTFSRLLQDLADRAWGPAEWDERGPAVEGHLEPEVTSTEVAALVSLLSRLESGRSPGEVVAEVSDAGVMLRAWLAAALVPDYLVALGPRPTFRGRVRDFSFASVGVRRLYTPTWAPPALGKPLAVALIVLHFPFRALRGVYRLIVASRRYRRVSRQLEADRLSGGAGGKQVGG